MTESWREFLYPLGFLASVAFGLRMLYQWMGSEAKKQSVVTPFFWKISLCGNLLLMIHGFIQIQFPVCFVQACNSVISWRNYNLMQPPDQRTTFKRTAIMMTLVAVLTFAAFIIQGYLSPSGDEWFRIPQAPWQSNAHQKVSIAWHFLGSIGLFLFNSRYWLQWWYAEKYQKSFLGSLYWWISLIGEILCLTYFIRIDDLVNYLGPLFGLIPYVRNLMLIYKSSEKLVGEKA